MGLDSRLKIPDRGDLEVVFEGSLTQWRSGVHLDVLIVSHSAARCMEVIVYNSEINREAPRMYVDTDRLFSKIPMQELEAYVATEKEILNRRMKDVVISDIEDAFRIKFAATFINSRIAVTDGRFRVFLQPQFGDTITTRENSCDIVVHGATEDGSYIDVLIPKPESLEPVVANHYARFRSSIFLSQMSNVKKDIEYCVNQREKAEMLMNLAVAYFIKSANRRKRLSQCCSTAKLRWLNAINRVINTNMVIKMQLQLKKCEDAKKSRASYLGDNSLISMLSNAASSLFNSLLTTKTAKVVPVDESGSGKPGNTTRPNTATWSPKFPVLSKPGFTQRQKPVPSPLKNPVASVKLNRSPSNRKMVTSESDALFLAKMRSIRDLDNTSASNSPRYATSTISHKLSLGPSKSIVSPHPLSARNASSRSVTSVNNVPRTTSVASIASTGTSHLSS